jgi:L-fuculose-phosphate aldolase
VDKNIITEILAVARRMDDKNLVNAFEGNISIKKNELIYITPTSKNKGILTEGMIAVVDSQGNQIHGNCKPTSELSMHMAAYRIRENIGGVVHCHPTFLTAHAICGIPVETRAYPEMIANFLRFEVAPYGRPGTEDILNNAIPFLKRDDVVLLGNHGVLAVGKTATEAMNKIEAAEAITKTLFFAHMLGKPVDLNDSEFDYFYDTFTNNHPKL